jgi:uracil-DNA glycosylase
MGYPDLGYGRTMPFSGRAGKSFMHWIDAAAASRLSPKYVFA